MEVGFGHKPVDLCLEYILPESGAIMADLNVSAERKLSRFCRPVFNSSNYIN